MDLWTRGIILKRYYEKRLVAMRIEYNRSGILRTGLVIHVCLFGLAHTILTYFLLRDLLVSDERVFECLYGNLTFYSAVN